MLRVRPMVLFVVVVFVVICDAGREAGARERGEGTGEGVGRELGQIRSAPPEERPVHIEVAKQIPVRVARVTVAASDERAKGVEISRRHGATSSFLLRMRVHYVCRGVVGRRWAHTHVRLVSPAPATPASPASSPVFPRGERESGGSGGRRHEQSLVPKKSGWCRSKVAAAAAVLAIVRLAVCVCVHGGGYRRDVVDGVLSWLRVAAAAYLVGECWSWEVGNAEAMVSEKKHCYF